MARIILDCDPGHDDAIAILLAAGNPDIDLLGITTVAGNHVLEKVTRNALAVCTVAGIDVPVAAGAAGPLVGEQIVAADIHGDSGLDGPVLPTPTIDLDPRHAVEFTIDTVMDHPPTTIDLVAVGPLTNVALAMRREPAIVARVRSVMLMGGAFTRGNTTPAAEFNIHADPEAAAAVLGGAWPVTMVPLDLTHQARATDEVEAAIAAVGGDLSDFVIDMFGFFRTAYERRQGLADPPVHDPVAVAGLVDPDVFTTRRAFVTVELRGEWTRGMTVTDFGDAYGRPHDTTVGIDLDRTRFWDLVVDAMRRLATDGSPA